MTKKSKYYYDTDRNIDNEYHYRCGTQNETKWKVPSTANFEWHLDKVADKVINLLKEKNKAYGDSALNPLNVFSKLDATESLCCRLDDKIARIRNKGINDKTEDTIDDLIGYLLLLKMAIERK